MKNTLFIASRLKYRRRIVTVSIAISYIVMIAAMAVSSGFRHEVRNALSQIGGDIQLCPYNLNYMDEAQPVDASPSYLPQIEMVEGVESVVPVIYRAGIVKAGDDIHGVVIKEFRVRIPYRFRFLSLGVWPRSVPCQSETRC